MKAERDSIDTTNAHRQHRTDSLTHTPITFIRRLEAANCPELGLASSQPGTAKEGSRPVARSN